MKTLTTQHSSPSGKMSWKLLPALLVALLSFCAVPSNGQTWTIGTGTSVYSQTGTSGPLGYYYPSARMQYLYLASELTAAGMTAGPIHQIAFNVGSLQSASAAPNYSIGVDNYGLATLPTSPFMYNSTTTRYTNTGGIPPALGWNNITFNTSTPFIWNGTSNVIVEVCYSKGAAGNGSGFAGVYYTASPTGTSVYNYNSTTGIALCGVPLAGSTLTYRPNIRFTKLLPCGGVPSAGTLTPSGTTTTLCPGSSVAITSAGYTNALNTTFQWWTSSSPTGPWAIAPGNSTDPSYITPPLISNTYYHLTITCGNSSPPNNKDSSANTGFTFAGGFPVYATLPFFEGFENWSNGCATSDKISSNNWTNTPSTGNSSWRREDQGASASWTTPAGNARPTPIEGSHEACFHYYAPVGPAGTGTLQLYVNTSATAGNKDLSFYYNFKYPSPSATYPGDSLVVDVSSDGGATFTPLPGGRIGYGAGPAATWNLVTIPNIAVSSPTTVFRFRASQMSTGYDDIYLDAVRIDPPCAGRPTAGKIDSVIVCSGKPFTLKLKGNVPAAGLTYLWQYRATGTTFWNPLPGGTVLSPTATITSNTDFRAIVTCNNTTPTVSDTTPVYSLTLAPFYYCYCGISVSASYINSNIILIGNVTIKTEPAGAILLNNGNPLPYISNATTYAGGYEDFRVTVPAPTLIRDSTYRIFITQTQNTSTTAFYPYGYGVAWLDKDRSGTFDASERILFKAITNPTVPVVSDKFTIDHTEPVGLTGLRALNSYYYSGYGISPCGPQYAYGQAEDYLVRIEYQPCSGPVDAGIAWASDSVICPGYTVDLFDTSYEHHYTNILRRWEVSTNGGASFTAIPGSFQKDTLLNVTVTATSKFRLRVICGVTRDTTYSNVLSVRAPEPVRCYPVSWAAPGGTADSSDIGEFVIGNFINPPASFPAGPHLLNPLAHQRRTDFTNLPPIELNADSTYRLAIFHTMPRAYHADAMVSVYIDFNNDLKYDQFTSGPPFTSELIFQGRTRFDSFFLDTKVKMPNAVIPNIPTGLRVVLNNDVSSATAAGNSGSGVFTSGEVEDYLVIFRRPGLSVGNSTLLQNLALYPNPTEGKFTVLSDAARSVSHLDVVVSTITGQQVLSRSFDNVGTHFSTNLDLSDRAKGIYFVEIRADGEKITKKLIVR